jgi:predicted 2-oxoglutarate/Fe(II)-dependent dioxygenase YbiX
MEPTYEVLEGNISADELRQLNEMVIKNSGYDPKPLFEGSGLIESFSVEVPENYPISMDPNKILLKVLNIVKDYFLDKYDMLGTLTFNRMFGVTMFEGAVLPAHRDEDANNDGIFDGMKRSHVCSLILNDDYEGGELVFPDQNTSVKAKAGDMVVFPGYYVSHGVAEITKGTRRVLLVFFYDVLS